ncbi:alkaline protease [Myriangium duriaei CBS 260.36]|uniref:Alkaline protease n=1 Tax=Myriangium duriaei CBS 260.36 TaxID=1168546 RepID=A0A9P4JAD8_9PEZI|nr:alkaline protease [Myriangium duriaei CBS 260.36]
MIFVQDLQAKSLKRTDEGTVFDGVSHEYAIGDFRAYAGHFDAAIVDQLRKHEDVAHIESDQTSTLTRMPWRKKRRLVSQKKVNYGLQLISHRGNNEPGVYWYDASAGSGTFAYVLDGGINVKHVEFQGRASLGYNAVKGSAFEDTEGHGTHVAGIIGSKTYGVAKKCNLIAVKTSHGGKGDASTVLDGLQWATKDIVGKKRQAKAVINISQGVPFSKALNDAVNAAFNQGVTTVAASGNNGIKASALSPGSAENSITVAATNAKHERADFSNWGPGVTLFAPGVDIMSTSIGSTKATRTTSGTSQAAPHVAGIVLYLKGFMNLPDAKSTKAKILELATKDVVDHPAASANLFAYNGSGK